MSQNNIFYPLSKEQQESLNNFNNGNFSLWHDKYIPLNDSEFKASDFRGQTDSAIELYNDRYKTMSGSKAEYLTQKHMQQIDFCKMFENYKGYKCTTVYAGLRNPMVTGIGQTHPSETSMVFEHNVGVPYIPASSIKGIIRFAYILSVIFNDDGTLKDEFENKEKIENLGNYGVSDIFGGDKILEGKSKSYKGGVIFLDAYPLTVPELKVDIMNPHYGDYYSNNETPPADYLSPVPIKFLTVKRGTEFVFRFVAKEGIADIALDALKKAITQEGIGAKTALGYGLFDIIHSEEPDILREQYMKFKIDNMSEEEKLQLERKEFMDLIEKTKEYSPETDRLFDEWQANNNLKTDKEMAELFKSKIRRKKSNGEFTKKFEILAEILNIELSTAKTGTAGSKDENAEDIRKLIEKIDRLLSKKVINKKDKKDNKKVSKDAAKFKDNEEVKEKISKLKKMAKY